MPTLNCPRLPISTDPPHRTGEPHGAMVSASLLWGNQSRHLGSKGRRRQQTASTSPFHRATSPALSLVQRSHGARTAFGQDAPSTKQRRLLTVTCAISRMATTVKKPWWPVTKTLGKVINR
jgi:hypothetical protein